LANHQDAEQRGELEHDERRPGALVEMGHARIEGRDDGGRGGKSLREYGRQPALDGLPRPRDGGADGGQPRSGAAQAELGRLGRPDQHGYDGRYADDDEPADEDRPHLPVAEADHGEPPEHEHERGGAKRHHVRVLDRRRGVARRVVGYSAM